MGRENGNDAEQTAFPSPESTRINFGQLGRGSLPHARGAIIPILIQTSMRIAELELDLESNRHLFKYK